MGRVVEQDRRLEESEVRIGKTEIVLRQGGQRLELPDDVVGDEPDRGPGETRQPPDVGGAVLRQERLEEAQGGIVRLAPLP